MKIFPLNFKKESNRIINFIKKTVFQTGLSKVIIPLSGGVDSTTTAFLCVRALGIKNVLIAQLPYGQLNLDGGAELVIDQLKIPKNNVFKIKIKPIVDLLKQKIEARSLKLGKVRLGNLMARVRMMMLYDLAKVNLNQALVCGTENKSEYLLGYYTLHGDSASDLEPIRHLYKIQVRELAKFLGVPEKIINQPPTAGLWPGQTDEGELGFSYQEADQILYLFFDKKYPPKKIINKGFKKITVEKVITRVNANSFKAKLPYKIS